jgi:hypothetical protein
VRLQAQQESVSYVQSRHLPPRSLKYSPNRVYRCFQLAAIRFTERARANGPHALGDCTNPRVSGREFGGNCGAARNLQEKINHGAQVKDLPLHEDLRRLRCLFPASELTPEVDRPLQMSDTGTFAAKGVN